MPNVGHQLRGGTSDSRSPENTPASLPSRIWVPISHVSCMPLLAGGRLQETCQHRHQVCHHSSRAGGQAENAAAAPISASSPAASGATKAHSGPRLWRDGCLHFGKRAALNGFATRCAATSDLITLVSSTSQLAAA